MTTRTIHILITGAASGIGLALATALARPGVLLHLTDRDAPGLERARRTCVGLGADVSCRALDIRDRAAVAAWVAAPPRIDLLFACAGITGGRPPRDADGIAIESEARVREMFDINLTGTLNTVLPAITRLRGQAPERRNEDQRNGGRRNGGKPGVRGEGVRGRIAVIASVAGFVAYPGTPAYGASKAALDRLVVACASSLEGAGITLTSVCCGFVDTPMVAGNRFPMPGLVSADHAARAILRGTLRGQRRVIFPGWLVLGARLGDLLPPRLMERYYLRQPSSRPAGLPDY